MPTNGAVFSLIADVFGVEANALNGFYDSAGRITGAYADIGHLTKQADIDAGYRIVELINEIDAPVLSEEAAFSLITGRDVITNPVVLMILSWVGEFDSSELVAMIEEARVWINHTCVPSSIPPKCCRRSVSNTRPMRKF